MQVPLCLCVRCEVRQFLRKKDALTQCRADGLRNLSRGGRYGGVGGEAEQDSYRIMFCFHGSRGWTD